MRSRPRQPGQPEDMLVEVVEIPMPWWNQSHLDRLDFLRGHDQEVHPPSTLPEKMSPGCSSAFPSHRPSAFHAVFGVWRLRVVEQASLHSVVMLL